MKNKRVKLKTFNVRGDRSNYNAIYLMSVPRYERDILIRNDYLKYIRTQNDDIKLQSLEIIFNIIRKNKIKSLNEKIIWNPYKGKITDIKELKKDTSSVPWTCAICGEPIYAKINNTKPENFLCNDCKNKKNTDLIDRRIVSSSIQFADYCKYILLKEQKKFVTYIHEREKRKKNKKK